MQIFKLLPKAADQDFYDEHCGKMLRLVVYMELFISLDILHSYMHVSN